MFLFNSATKARLENKIKTDLFVSKSICLLVCGDSVSSCSPIHEDYKKVTLVKLKETPRECDTVGSAVSWLRVSHSPKVRR